MAAPEEILRLLEQYDSHRQAYESGRYKETQLRHEFVDKFFIALGWDVNNERGYAEAYKDVVHEDAIKIGGVTKAPDYCFRIGGVRKFFVEAKKPSVHIKGDTSAAYQLRRYAWSSKLPLSILTDFDEFAVYDCRQKPSPTDKASTARTMYLTYRDYPQAWDEIAAIFSREAILKGSFDKYAEDNKAKRGTAEVDDAFLTEIESWRESLAHNIALRNPALKSREFNFAVQATINRIIFLRICEARGIESYGLLLGLVNGKNVYQRLTEMFLRADERYNSGLFHFHDEKGFAQAPDSLTLTLTVDDKPLKDIIKNLYYPDSPYEFSVLPVDILGQVYERFLGKVIRLTPKHQAVVEDKPEVKKAGGVYYTPTYIVDYIVKNTVGRLIEGKKPKDVDKLKVADIACGSGSFLIGAYQYLLDWYKEQYVKDGPTRHKKELRQTATGDWSLTPAERKRILLNNIYGVDIDSQAVEVTKLSLLLKVLEGETGETLATQLKMFQERALPDLGSNIKCGNSLIDSGFYASQQLSFLSEDERYRINVFDWHAEFPHVFGGADDGFDVIVGNPPYIRIQALKEWAPIEVEYYKRKFTSASKGNYDVYAVFVEQGLRLLNRRGSLGYILPHKFFNAQYGEPLRALIADGKYLRHIVHFGDEQVFSGATTYTCLLFLDKAGQEQFTFTKADDLLDWRTTGRAIEGALPASNAGALEWNFAVGQGASLFDKLQQMPVKLGDMADRIYQGLVTGGDSVYLFRKSRPSREQGFTEVYSEQLKEWMILESSILKPVVRSGNIRRYWANPTHLLLFPYSSGQKQAQLLTPEEMTSLYPLAWNYLNLNRTVLEARDRGKLKGKAWYRYSRTQNIGMWEQSKLMIPYMITELAAYLDKSEGLYFSNVTTGGYGLTTRESTVTLAYLCGLLNSRLLDFCLKEVSSNFRSGYFAANKQFIEQLPIRTIDFANKADRAKHDRMVTLVEQMLTLHKQLLAANTAHEKTAIQRQIDALDKMINDLVYELYGLSEEEIRIVEESTR